MDTSEALEPSTPVYDATCIEMNYDPADSFMLPKTPPFTMFGYKKRKKLADQTAQVLRDAGFKRKP